MKSLQASSSKPAGGNGALHVKEVDSVCPYCGVGCALTYVVDPAANRILYVKGREVGAPNAGRLCVKGRYGYDYTSHAQRLTKPLIRKEGSYPKGPLSVAAKDSNGHRKPGGLVDYAEVLPHFREASWDEALDLAGNRLKAIRDTHGSEALAGFGSAKGTNEEAYLFQKLVRAGFGTNNVDHCTRLCHASSVAALMEGINSGAVTNVVRDIERAEVALVTGCNPTHNHPVAATFMKQAAASGKTKLLVVNPRRPDLADYAALYVKLRSGTDVAFYNGMMHVMIAEDLVDHDFIAERVTGFDELKALVAEYPPERVAKVCGVPAEQVVEAARMLGQAKSAMIFWGMGISQHTNGTNNARCLIALAMITGNVGKPGSGLHPLRGQNNVQGASDAGLIPMVYPDYQAVDNPEVQAKFERLWGAKLSPNKGLTVTEITHGALEGEIKGMYVMGENPFISDPDTNKVRRALAALDFLVVQDIFLTETAEFADVILPASSAMEKTGTFTNTDRRVQTVHPALTMPGEARQDWEVICEIGSRLGVPMHYGSVSEVFDEFVATTNAYKTLSYEHLGDTGKWYPCPDPAHSEGQRIVFDKTFPSGKAKLVPAHVMDPNELPSDDFPFVLNTGRILEHWHTGVMTRRSQALSAIEPEAFLEMHPLDAENLGLEEDDYVTVSSRRGTITTRVRLSDAPAPGSIFIPMHFREAAANVLTNPAVDPWGMIPEFKFCAVKIEKYAGGDTVPVGGRAI